MHLASALTTIAVVATCLTAMPAAAQMPQFGTRPACNKADVVTRQLSNKYSEQPIALGIQANGQLLQIFASSATGSWTVVTTTPTGISCLIASGQSWQALKITPDGPLT